MNKLVVLLAIISLASLALPASVALHVETEKSPALVKRFFPTIQKRLDGSGNQASPNMQYHEGAVHHAPRVYLVFWGWLGPGNPATDPNGEAAILQDFFGGVGGSAWANVQTQYADRAATLGNPGNQLGGVWWDDDLVNGFPVQPDLFLANEALRASEHFGYDPDGNYFIATPHLHNDAQFGAVYCAWHSWQSDSHGNTVAFTDLPYMPDAASTGCPGNFVNAGSTTDAITIVGGHEYAETVTDPHGDGWFDTTGAGENGDKCAWDQGVGARSQNIVLSTGTFPVQALWSNVDSACAVTYAGAAGAALDPGSGGGPPPIVPIVYHESGSVTLMTVQPLVIGLNTQWNDLGQGVSVYRLDDASIRTLGGQNFTLKATSGAAPVQDFDIYYYDASNNIIGSGAGPGDEAGVVPLGVDHAMVMLSSGQPGTFDFDTG